MRKPLIVFGAVLAVIAVVVALSNVGPSAAPSPSPSSAAAGSPAAEATLLWPAPTDPMERAVAAGLEPAPQEFTTNHVHSHLDVFVDGQEVLVPAGIGINGDDPEVRYFEDIGS